MDLYCLLLVGHSLQNYANDCIYERLGHFFIKKVILRSYERVGVLFFRSRTNGFFKDETSCYPLYLVVPTLRDYEDAASIRAIDSVSFS